jgi:uncharacterized protein (TIGR03437 family)
LLLFDPLAVNTPQLSAIPVILPPPTPPNLPAPSGRVFQANRAQLVASDDGTLIVGMNLPNAAFRTVFTYEAASGAVLGSRTVTGASSTLTISPDKRRFMAGLTLFETSTLNVLAQQNLANAPYPIPANTNFNLQTNQGGSVFAPGTGLLYSAFNVAPVANPPARPNISQLMFSDPENLLIQGALQMPENLAGKILAAPDGGTLFALSESGFVIVPLNQLAQSPIALPDRTDIQLTNDQCGITADSRVARVSFVNQNRNVNLGPVQQPQLLDTNNNPAGLGGPGGPGGGIPGGGGPGGAIIIGPGGPIIIPGFPGQPGGIPNQQNALLTTAPTVRPVQGGAPAVDFVFNSNANRAVGTASPAHNYLVQAPLAVNLPPRIRVYQNNRNSEFRASVRTVQTSISTAEALTDISYDAARRRVYVTNSGMNRVEVFDTRTNEFTEPIKVGQLPRSMAQSLDGSLLFVANSGSEYISIVNLDSRRETGRITMPPIPFNSNTALITPLLVAMTQRGLLVMMNNGTLWRAVGNDLLPRPLSAVLGATNVIAGPTRSMAATPNGEYALVLAGNGTVYLYDALADDFVQSRQVFATAQQRAGYFGPITAGARGQYYVVNGTVLNQSLTPVATSQTVIPGFNPGQAAQAQNTPVSGVAALGPATYLRLTRPVAIVQGGGQAGAAGAAAAAAQTEPPAVEFVDANTGFVTRRLDAVEAPLAAVAGNQQVNLDGRLLAVDAQATTAYAITASGLQIIPLDVSPMAALNRPLPNVNGTVSMASYAPAIGQGGLISIFGRNLAGSGTAPAGSTLPVLLGDVCVTLNNSPIPLMLTSPTQINAQIPPNLAPGRYPLLVRSTDRKTVSLQQLVTVSRYAPAVFVAFPGAQAAIFHPDGGYVTPQRPLTRDRRAFILATGLGPVTGGTIAAGVPAPANTATQRVEVFFGDPRVSQSPVVVEKSTLVEGMVGVYRIDIYVPGDRNRGTALPVTLRVGGVSSPSSGPAVPTVAVE